MKIRTAIDIAATPETVWPLVADPEQMAAWHERLVSVRRETSGTVRRGERFAATYTMSGRQGNAEVEVIRCQPPVELTYRHHVKMGRRDGYVDESYDLVADEAGTHLKQIVDFAGSGMPRWAQALMWFVSRFGRAVEPGLLEPLKKEAEQTGAT
jgi:hypothetical protein